MTEEHLAAGTEPDGIGPAVELIQELLICGWIADSAASTSDVVRAVNLASPSRSWTLRVEADGHRVQLVLDAPTRGGHRFRYAWAATAPVLSAQVVLAVAAANDADAKLGFDENNAVDLDVLTAAGWRQELNSRWEHPDGRVLQAQASGLEHPWVSITIGHDGDDHPIRATQHTSNQVLQALTDGTAPEPAAGRTAPTHPLRGALAAHEHRSFPADPPAPRRRRPARRKGRRPDVHRPARLARCSHRH